VRRLRQPYHLLAIAVTVVIGTVGVLAYQMSSPPQRVQLTFPSADAARISFFALGDQGSGQYRQWTVARSMEKVAERSGDPDFVVLLGDSFYSYGVGSIDDRVWNWKFEKMYSGARLAAIPFYAVLGNHDVLGNAEAQIEYSRAQAGSGRWQMPAHQYRKDFGNDQGRPLLRVVFIDTNRSASEGLEKQIRFIEESFAPSAGQPTWRVVVAHHPIRNLGRHGETPRLAAILLPVLQKYHIDLYVTGHDHDQQLIARDGEPYYVISGGGGQSLYHVSPGQDGLLFGKSQHGFCSIAVDSSAMQISFYDDDAEMASRYAIKRDCAEFSAACVRPALAAAKSSD